MGHRLVWDADVLVRTQSKGKTQGIVGLCISQAQEGGADLDTSLLLDGLTSSKL